MCFSIVSITSTTRFDLSRTSQQVNRTRLSVDSSGRIRVLVLCALLGDRCCCCCGPLEPPPSYFLSCGKFQVPAFTRIGSRKRCETFDRTYMQGASATFPRSLCRCTPARGTAPSTASQLIARRAAPAATRTTTKLWPLFWGATKPHRSWRAPSWWFTTTGGIIAWRVGDGVG